MYRQIEIYLDKMARMMDRYKIRVIKKIDRHEMLLVRYSKEKKFSCAPSVKGIVFS